MENYHQYYRSVYRDAEKKRKKEIKNYPGLIIIEIDGLAYDVLKEAIDKVRDIVGKKKDEIDELKHTIWRL